MDTGESLLDLCFVVLKLSIYCFCNKGCKNGMIGVVMIPSLGCHGPNPRRPVSGSDFDDILAFTTELFGLHEAWSCLRTEDAVEICCVLIWLSCVPQAAIGMIRPISTLTLRGQGGSGQKVGLDL